MFLAELLLRLKMKRKKEVNEYWEKIDRLERKQINEEIEKKTYEELIQKEIILRINETLKIQKNK